MKTLNYLLDKAIIIATDAHSGQMDKCGEPYILHPIRVMLSLSSLKERVVAILHDVLEDSIMDENGLKAEGFPADVIAAVVAMSKIKGEKYLDFIERCCKNKLAINVKRADISDNSSPIRLYKLDLETRQRLRMKYAKAINYIDSLERM